MRTAVSLM